MRLKMLAATCLAASLSSFTVASAESDICKEIEWWIVDAQSDPPFSSFDPGLKSANKGEYRPASAVETANGKPCKLSHGLRSSASGLQYGRITCDMGVDGNDYGVREAAESEYEALKAQISQCRVLHGWRSDARLKDTETYASWMGRSETHAFELKLETRDFSISGPFGGTDSRYELDLSLLSQQYKLPASAETAPPLPTQKATPRNMQRWGTRVANTYPEIAERMGWEGTVGLTVIVDDSGRPKGCSVTRSSGWPVLDHTACEGMKTHARFERVQDAQGNPVDGIFKTRIAYTFN